jgi:hypothetical protein
LVIQEIKAMSNIQLSELNPAGSELFMDSESFLQDLTDTDAMVVQGGQGGDINKLLEFGIGAYAINGVISVAKSFSRAPGGGGGGGGGGGEGEEDDGGGTNPDTTPRTPQPTAPGLLGLG